MHSSCRLISLFKRLNSKTERAHRCDPVYKQRLQCAYEVVDVSDARQWQQDK
jgi:hypothetical protein